LSALPAIEMGHSSPRTPVPKHGRNPQSLTSVPRSYGSLHKRLSLSALKSPLKSLRLRRISNTSADHSPKTVRRSQSVFNLFHSMRSRVSDNGEPFEDVLVVQRPKTASPSKNNARDREQPISYQNLVRFLTLNTLGGYRPIRPKQRKSFGDLLGSITNRVSSKYNIISRRCQRQAGINHHTLIDIRTPPYTGLDHSSAAGNALSEAVIVSKEIHDMQLDSGKNDCTIINSLQRPLASNLACSKLRRECRKLRPSSQKPRKVSTAPVLVDFPDTSSAARHTSIYESSSKAISDLFEKCQGQLSSVCTYDSQNRIIKAYPKESAPNLNQLRRQGLETIWLPMQGELGNRAFLDAMILDKFLLQRRPQNAFSGIKSSPFDMGTPSKDSSLRRQPGTACKPLNTVVSLCQADIITPTEPLGASQIFTLSDEGNGESSKAPVATSSPSASTPHNGVERRVKPPDPRYLGFSSPLSLASNISYGVEMDPITSFPSAQILSGNSEDMQNWRREWWKTCAPHDHPHLSRRSQSGSTTGDDEPSSDVSFASGFRFTAYAALLEAGRRSQSDDYSDSLEEVEKFRSTEPRPSFGCKCSDDKSSEQVNGAIITRANCERQSSTVSTSLRYGPSNAANYLRGIDEGSKSIDQEGFSGHVVKRLHSSADRLAIFANREETPEDTISPSGTALYDCNKAMPNDNGPCSFDHSDEVSNDGAMLSALVSFTLKT
jgi:hypothetical protein